MGLFSKLNKKETVQPAKSIPIAQREQFYVFYIAGLYYRKDDAIELLDDDDEYEGPCKLVPEPKNKYDPNAIKVMIKKVHVGYVPADKCLEVKGMLDTAVDFEANLELDDDELTGCVTISKW